MAKDYYSALGVDKSASNDDIKKAYRKMAMKYHPDRNKGDAAAEAKFKEINEAYEVLKDPQKKAAYDRYGADAFANGGFNNASGNGFNPNDFGFGFGGASGFSDIFEDFFGRAAGGSSSHREEVRGSDLRYDASLTLEEAFSGKKIQIKMNTYISCDACNGSGSDDGKTKVCPACRGSGRIRASQGFFTIERTCSHCNGLGQIIEKPCRKCNGAGRYQKNRVIEVNIPAGVDNGTRVRVAGEGEGGIRGGANGDLYVFVNIKRHSIF